MVAGSGSKEAEGEARGLILVSIRGLIQVLQGEAAVAMGLFPIIVAVEATSVEVVAAMVAMVVMAARTTMGTKVFTVLIVAVVHTMAAMVASVAEVQDMEVNSSNSRRPQTQLRWGGGLRHRSPHR